MFLWCVKVKNLMRSFPTFTSIALGLMGAMALVMPPAQALNIGVSPSRFEVEINNQGRSQSVRVVNLSSEPVEVKTLIQSWVMSQDNTLQTVASDEQSLAQWIVYTPSRFTIPANGAQTIRFAIRPKVKPIAGEHRAVLYVEEIPSNNAPTNKVRVVGKLGVVIYGYVGNVKRVGILNSVTVDTNSTAIKAIFDISNQGNAYVRLNGQYAIWPATKYPGNSTTKSIPNLGRSETKIPEGIVDVGFLPSQPVLPNNNRRAILPITKTLPPGNYVFDINGDLSGTPIKKSIPFTVLGKNR